MVLDARFHFVRLDGGDQSRPLQLREAVLARLAPVLKARGGTLWGTWAGIFGVGSTELLTIVSFPSETPAPSGLLRSALDGWDRATVVEEYGLMPTNRPSERTLISREGLYVFRYFEIPAAKIDDFAELSEAGWVSFEHDEAFETLPTGLFVVDGVSDRRTMLLVTWYDGLASWQRSRQFPTGARENFMRRGEFTLRSLAFATRLLA